MTDPHSPAHPGPEPTTPAGWAAELDAWVAARGGTMDPRMKAFVVGMCAAGGAITEAFHCYLVGRRRVADRARLLGTKPSAN